MIFRFTDRLLEEMVNYGIEPFFRLGATIENFHFLGPITFIRRKTSQVGSDL